MHLGNLYKKKVNHHTGNNLINSVHMVRMKLIQPYMIDNKNRYFQGEDVNIRLSNPKSIKGRLYKFTPLNMRDATEIIDADWLFYTKYANVNINDLMDYNGDKLQVVKIAYQNESREYLVYLKAQLYGKTI